MYAVVLFSETNRMAVVASNWLMENDTKCLWPKSLWPSTNSENFQKLVKARSQLDVNSTKAYDVKIFKKTASYDEARQYLPKSECSNTENTSKEKKRGKRQRIASRSCSSESEIEEEELGLPDTPPHSQRRDLAEGAKRKGSRQRKSPSPSPDLPKQATFMPEAAGNSIIATSLGVSYHTGEGNSTPLLHISCVEEPCASAPNENCRGHDETLASVVKREIALATQNILKEIAIIKEQNKQILKALSQPNGAAEIEEPAAARIYPLTAVDKADELEDILKKSASARKQLRNELCLLGGTSVRAVATNMIKHLFHDSLGVLYSLYGQKGKRPLVNTIFYRIIVESVRRSTCPASASDEEINASIMGWLKNCQARLNNAKRYGTTQKDE